MVAVVIELYPDSCLKMLVAEGHADSGVKGHDLVCAAFSVLMRTALNVLAQDERLIAEGDIEKEGKATLQVRSYPLEATSWLKGVTDFLLTGLFDLMVEYPKNLSISFEHSESEEEHGT